MQPLITYLAREAAGKTPLELCGCDCQFTGSASRKLLAAEASGVAVVDGLMVDAIHIRMAHQVLERFEKGDR